MTSPDLSVIVALPSTSYSIRPSMTQMICSARHLCLANAAPEKAEITLPQIGAPNSLLALRDA